MLKASYEDACLISRKAHADMNFFSTTTVATKGKGPAKGGVLTVSTDYEKWHRILATYISLFGSRPFDDQGAVKLAFQDIEGTEHVFYFLKGCYDVLMQTQTSTV
jgi:hypothetical protein